jgi:hypothetical protein
MTRERGRKYVDICLLAYDAIIEGLYQGRLNLLGVDPHPSAVPHIAADIGIPNGLYETIRHYAIRMRRRNWSWRAAGLAGVADIFVNTEDYVGDIPTMFSGQPTEAGVWLSVIAGGTVGTPGIMIEISTDGGMSYAAAIDLGAATTLTVGSLVMTWQSGDSIPVGTLRLQHGGRGLRLNDLSAPIRGSVAASSPAGDESILYELAQQVGDCRIRLVTMRVAGDDNMPPLPSVGTWWTREVDGTVWRWNNGPWAWETALDIDETHWARGLIIIESPPNIDRWEVLGAETHYLDEPNTTFGTSATMEWWNRLYVTAYQFKPAHIHALSIILNFDSTKFNPNDMSTCMQGDWFNPHEYDEDGNVTLTRPVEYAHFSRDF